MRTYLQIFLLTSLGFSAVYALIGGIWDDWQEAITTGLIRGIAIGAVLSLFLGTIHRRRMKELGLSEPVSPRYNQTVTVPRSLSDTLELCEDVLIAANTERIKTTPDRTQLTASTRSTWDSFGERISITLAAVDDTRTDVTIASAPIIKVTIMDFGKGVRNVRDLLALLEQRTVIERASG